MDDFIVGPQCEEIGLMEEVHNMVDEMWDAVAAEIGEDIVKELKVESVEHIPMDDRIKELAKEYNVVIEHHLNVGDSINEYHTNLDGCGYVVATCMDVEESIEKAMRVKNVIDNSIVRI